MRDTVHIGIRGMSTQRWTHGEQAEEAEFPEVDLSCALCHKQLSSTIRQSGYFSAVSEIY